MDNYYASSIAEYVQQYSNMLCDDKQFKENTEQGFSIHVIVTAFILSAYCRTHNISATKILPVSRYFYQKFKTLDESHFNHTNVARTFSICYANFIHSTNMCAEFSSLSLKNTPLIYNYFPFLL